MYEIIKSYPIDQTRELRLAKINRGYSVGIWDTEANEYPTGLWIFPYKLSDALGMAEHLFNQIRQDEENFLLELVESEIKMARTRDTGLTDIPIAQRRAI